MCVASREPTCSARPHRSDERSVVSVTSFNDLGLAYSLLRAVRDEGYHTATPIQLQAIPPVLAGHDLMGCAQTGTGKTAAFALPALQRLATRAGQVAADVKRRGRHRRNDWRPIRTLVL